MQSTDQTPRLRERRRTFNTRAVLALLMLLIMMVAGFMIINSAYFIVGTVVVGGNKYISSDEVLQIAAIPEPVNIFRLRTNEIKRRLSADLRIASVEVIRKFPCTIVINVQERQPLAYIANAYGFVELDQQGVVLATYKNLKQLNLPMLTGIRLDTEYIGDTVNNANIKGILPYLALLDEHTLNNLSEINIKNPEKLVAYTTNSIQVRLGNTERMEEKAKLTQDILAEIYNKKMIVEYIDLTFAVPFIKFKQ